MIINTELTNLAFTMDLRNVNILSSSYSLID